MITRLRAQNFKSWRDTGELRFAPLTGLFGTNSSGKSSILQTLLLLRQTIVSTDLNRVLNLGGDETAIVDLGTFHDVAYRQDPDAVVQISMGWNPERFPNWPVYDPGPLEFDVGFAEKDNAVRISEFSYLDRDGVRVGMRSRADRDYDAFYKRHGFEEHRVGPVPPPVGCCGFSQNPVTAKLALRHEHLFPYALRQELQRFAYLGPLRHDPKRTYLWSGSRPTDVGRAGELAVQALLASRTEGGTAEADVAQALKRIGLASSFRLDPIAPNRRDYEVRIKISERAAEVSLPEVGFGVSQVIPLLVLCHYAPANSVLIVEQPEIHLHPSAQSELADVLMDAVKNRDIQIIVESHSEHLLRRIQRRVAEEKFPANDAALYFCEMQDGESKAIPLEITDDGFIKNWPKDFFGDEMGDLSAMTEAAAKRHLTSSK